CAGFYRDFIEEASRCHVDALQHHEGSDGAPGLVALYAKLNRMRVLSSTPVVRSAEHIARTIMDTYLEPDKSFSELRDMAKRGSIDLLREFSEARREEFDAMRDRELDGRCRALGPLLSELGSVRLHPSVRTQHRPVRGGGDCL